MTQEYWAIKEQFGFLRNVAKYMDTLREIRTIYPEVEDMTIRDVEEMLTNRYAEMDVKLEEELKHYNDNAEQSPLIKKITEDCNSLMKVLKNVEVKRKKSKGILV